MIDMLIIDILRLSTRSLAERKLRAALTIIGIAIGPMALLMIGGIVSGYGEYIISSIKGLGQNIIVITPEAGYRLSSEDLDYISRIPGVIDVAPFYTTQGEISIEGARKTIYVYGVDPVFITRAISSLVVREGYAPSRSELNKALVGYDIIYTSNGRRLYEPGDVLSITIYRVSARGRVEVKKMNVVITGILDKYGGAVFLNPDNSIFVPIDSLVKALGINEWSGILVLTSSPDYVERVTREIENSYRNNVGVISFLAIAKTVSSVVGAVDFVTFAASTSAFAVAIAGVAASMITSVMERTREIGVMKAVGFRDSQVLLLVLAEGLVMSVIGYVIGSFLGVIGANALSSIGLTIGDLMKIEAGPRFTVDLIARSLVMTMSVGVLGALFPAYRAMKIPPAVALRYE